MKLIDIDDIVATVEDVVQNLFDCREMFSAFDVTRLVRQKLSGGRVAHKEIREILRSEIDFDNEGYTAMTWNGPQYSTQVWVPPFGDVNAYDPENLAPQRPGGIIPMLFPVAGPTTTVSSNATVTVSNTAQALLPKQLPSKRSGAKAKRLKEANGKFYWLTTPNKSGKLTITRKMLRSLGWHILSGTFYVAPRANGQDGLVILTKRPTNPDWVEPRKAPRGDITITKRALTKARLTTPIKVLVDRDNAVIVLTSHT